MSFSQVRGRNEKGTPSPYTSQKKASKTKPSIRAYEPPPEAAPKTRPQKRPVVLHGRIVKDTSTDSMSEPSNGMNYAETLRTRKEEQRQTSVRTQMTRKSQFSSLNIETQQFQKMVADLEEMLEQSGDSPEMAWRAKILMTSAQATDKELWENLYQYERTLMVNSRTCNSDELRMAQSACMKLHRDFKRSHKALVMAISLNEKRRGAEISQLGAVGWSAKDEDFFDRAMREDEMNKINRSMHQVKEMYEDLGGIVAEQQEDVDLLEDNILNAKDNVEKADTGLNCFTADDVRCAPNEILGDEGVFSCGAFDYDNFTKSLSLSMGGEEDEDTTYELPTSAVGAKKKDMRVSEKFHWRMPFETIKDDLDAVKGDIVGLGADLASNTMECGPQRV